jgi:hypothetical protein
MQHLHQIPAGHERKGTASAVLQPPPPQRRHPERSEGPLYFAFAFSCFAILLTGCRTQPYDVVIHNTLLKLAGEQAFDCGRATTNDENVQQSACALDHLSQHKPFFVQYKTTRTDAVSEQGFALDANSHLVVVDTFSWGPAAPVGKINVTNCNPHVLRKSANGYLICY